MTSRAEHSRISVGLVGARGYVGAELARLLVEHPSFELAFLSSRRNGGRALEDEVDGTHTDLEYEVLTPEQIAERDCEVVVLALPNGKAAEIVAALDRARRDPVVLDLSADYRFDDDWQYGLPERRRAALVGSRRIANPGCYATGIQLAVAPVLDALAAPVHAFGVSGYSGAGKQPSERNDFLALKGGILPYKLTGHVHEREVSHHLGHPVCFMPHVAPFYRGISLTVAMSFRQPTSVEALVARYREAYAREALVDVTEAVPRVQEIAGKFGVALGGFTVSEDGMRGVVVATLDNLLKGAASQAVQNLNLACGLDELEGLRVARTVSEAPTR